MAFALSRLRSFAAKHDDLPAFHAGYIVLTFLVAALFRLGMFGLLIAIHMALDFVKYREFKRWKLGAAIRASFREALPDLALFSIGLAFAVYFHHSLPIIATVSGILRALLSLVGAIGTLTPKYEILHRFLRTVRDLPAHFRSGPLLRAKHFEPMESFSLFVLAGMIVLLGVAPLLLGTTAADVGRVMVMELQIL